MVCPDRRPSVGSLIGGGPGGVKRMVQDFWFGSRDGRLPPSGFVREVGRGFVEGLATNSGIAAVWCLSGPQTGTIVAAERPVMR